MLMCLPLPTVLSPTAGTLQWPSAIVVNFEIESDSCSDSHTLPACRTYHRQQFPSSSAQTPGKQRTIMAVLSIAV